MLELDESRYILNVPTVSLLSNLRLYRQKSIMSQIPRHWALIDESHHNVSDRQTHAYKFLQLYVGCTKDEVCPPALAAASAPLLPDLTTASIDAAHWVQYEKPTELAEEVSKFLREKF